MRILLAGGRGFLGQLLTQHLPNDHFIILTRNQRVTSLPPAPNTEWLTWSGDTTGSWCSQLNNMPPIDAVINLCGDSIGGEGFIPKRWSKANQKRMLDSRILSSQMLSQWLAHSPHKPRVFIQQSGIDFYGCNTPKPVDESSPVGESFLAQLAQKWESSITLPDNSPIRLITTRCAPVLHPERPPLLQWIWSTKLYLGATVGNSDQAISWLHYKDYAPIIETLLHNQQAEGVYNLCAPNALTYQDMAQTLATVSQRPLWFHIPAPAIKLALGEASTLALDSRHVLPTKLLADKTPFLFKNFQTAAEDFIHHPPA